MAMLSFANASTSEVEAHFKTNSTLNECAFQWEVLAGGITLGTTHDTVRWGKTSTSVVSLFTPNTIATMLGAPTLARKWFSSGNQNIVREENKYKREAAPDKVRWTANEGKIWKNVNQDTREEFPAPAGSPDIRYIDSTIFAYLDLVGQPVAETPEPVWVLNRKAPYKATTQRTSDTMEYHAGNKHGTVWVHMGKPTRLSFSEGNSKFEARVVSSNCK